MMRGFVLAAMVVGGLGAGPALAQAGPGAAVPGTAGPADGSAPARSPTLGDPAAAPEPRTAQSPAATDQPAPTSTNGNQPDRAAAGGGAR